MQKGKIEVEALTYIRGRSISNAFVIIDEAQNLTAHEVKTIITRIGENTKIWHWSHISSGAEIGCNCSLGQNVFIGNKVKIGGGSGVVKDIEDNQIVMGYPAVPLKDFIKKNKD